MDHNTHTNKKTEKASADFAGGVCNDLIANQEKVNDPAVRPDVYADRKTQTSKNGKFLHPGIIKMAAGAAGLFLAAGMTPLNFISGQTPEKRPSLPAEQDMLIPALDPQPGDRSSDDAGGEEELLLRWGLDPQDFPAQNDKTKPEIPEELLPYFQEMTADAVYSYGGTRPPEKDMSRYSPRSSAIRRAVRRKAEAFCRASVPYALYHVGKVFRKTADEAGPIYVTALQGIEKKSELPVVSWELPGLKRQDNVFRPGIPFRPAEDPEASGFQAALSGDLLSDHDPDRNSEQDSHQKNEQFPDAEKDRPEIYGPFLPAEALETGSDPDGREVTEPFPVTDLSGRPARESGQEQVFSVVNALEQDQFRNPADDELFPGLAFFPEPEDARPASPESSLQFSDLRADPACARILPLKDPSSSSGPRRTVFIGDSRTVGMQIYVDSLENEFWSAKNSMGYRWLVSSGVPAVEDLIVRNTDVVILMGVNDLGNAASYVDYMNEKAAEWKRRGARTFFVSVTPVIDSKSPNAKNSRIESFNEYAQENLKDVIYIDAYNRIRYTFGSPDGIHFDRATYQEIYRIIHFYQYSGWYEDAGLCFYFDKGRPLTGWHFLDGEWQYMDGAGVRWISRGRVGDVVLDGFPETGLLNPYRAVLPESLIP